MTNRHDYCIIYKYSAALPQQVVEKMGKIIVADDEQRIRKLVCDFLKREGHEPIEAEDGDEAYSLFVQNSNCIDLMILDIMMPGLNGWEVCRKVREVSSVPVIMLTARSEEFDELMGYESGADDYVTKPFNPLELTARVKAHLRRYKQYNTEAEDKNVIEINGLSINNETHKCFVFDEEIPLTPTEFGILRLLCENAGRVVSTEDIFEKVWGEKYLDSNNTVMVHIRRIREKLHEPSRNPRFVKTVWGVGYKIEK